MIEILKGGLHLFIIAMIFLLGIGGMIIASGQFDSWGKRQNWRTRKRRMNIH